MKIVTFDENFSETDIQFSKLILVPIMPPNRRQVIVNKWCYSYLNDVLVYWCINASLGLDELRMHVLTRNPTDGLLSHHASIEKEHTKMLQPPIDDDPSIMAWSDAQKNTC